MNSKFAAMVTGLALAVSLFPASSALAYSVPGKAALEPTMQVAAIAPLSMQYFCANNRRECVGGGASQVTMTPNLMAVLKQVNVHVNRAITPKKDAADIWALNPTSGDCEDYVLSKRSALIRQGVSAGALRIALTHTRRGTPHAILVVKTSDGDYVLDNLTNSVRTLRASGYRIRSISSSNPMRWTAG